MTAIAIVQVIPPGERPDSCAAHAKKVAAPALAGSVPVQGLRLRSLLFW